MKQTKTINNINKEIIDETKQVTPEERNPP
jgi:hypothetical protein